MGKVTSAETGSEEVTIDTKIKKNTSISTMHLISLRIKTALNK